MHIAMVGTGCVGPASGAPHSDFGQEVVCIDNDQGRIEALRRAEIAIFEPGGLAIARQARTHGKLSEANSQSYY